MADTKPVGLRYPWDTPPAHDEAIEVAPGVLWLRLPLPMKLDHVNVYAFDEGESWTIVDTGFSSKKTKAIWTDLIAGPLSFICPLHLTSTCTCRWSNLPQI